MRIARMIGRALALELIVPAVLAAQTHNLTMNDHVRVLYAVGPAGGSVEGDVARLTEDSLGLAVEEDGNMTLAWVDIATASVWRTQKPERYIGGLMGGMAGALVGAFASVNMSPERAVSEELSGWAVGRGAALGFIGGALLGVGVAQLIRPHGWQRVDVHPEVTTWGSGGLGVSVSLGRW